ncbi:coproporphyrinogen III oxidase family protein [bacterium]|nr:coproporphyrinogen III oxidase family protein [bacterium]
MRSFGLYVHVPFCGSICAYCHFARSADHDAGRRAAFVDGVLREFELRRQACPALGTARRPLATAYIGGGTPSQLEPELMARLLAGTVGRCDRAADLELTAEANPETFTPELAQAWLAAGVGRVSLGVQSLDAGVLRRLGRACDPATARGALALACARFPRVSADWILGPGVRLEALLAELDEAVALGVGHVSLYILEVHAGTALAARVADGSLKLPPDEEVRTAYLAAARRLAGHGLLQYEVANFARPGDESRHNRAYWRRRPWLGLGPGAHGAWGRWRRANHETLAAWLADLDAGRLPEAAVEDLGPVSRRLERVVLALRTREGVPLGWLPPNALDLERGEAEGLWRREGGSLRLTGDGFLRLDTIEEALSRRF